MINILFIFIRNAKGVSNLVVRDKKDRCLFQYISIKIKLVY